MPDDVERAGSSAPATRLGTSLGTRLGLFALLTTCGFIVFALTMTFAPLFPTWANFTIRIVLLAILGALWRAARNGSRLSRFRPIFFAYFTAVFGLSLGFVFTDRGLALLGLTTQTPIGVAAAKLLQSSLTVIGILAVSKLSGQTLASLYIRKGRLLLSLGVGLVAAGALGFLSLHQPAVTALSAARLGSLAPMIAIFVLSNAFMEELLFRGLFLGRYEALVGKWLAIFSTAIAFTLAHMQVTYAPQMLVFLLATFALSICWGWLTQKTGNLWGSTLFHAGADLLIIIPIFTGLGAL
jgi:membrane protease YdiL (CAAX protease family)